ncbi:hypothetical protein PR002_g28502, partial [Phytophthora rubi]
MRLYHALLVTAAAMLASNVSAGRADCDMVPEVTTPSSGSYETSSGSSVDTPVTQDSAAASDVGASQASQGSAPSDTPVQQYSTTNSDVGASQASQGSAPSDTPVQQYSTANSDVGASQASQGSAPSDTPVQQPSTSNSNVASTSGSGAPSSDDDTKQGVVIPASTSGSGSSPSAATDVGASQETTSGSGAPPSKEGLTTPAPTSPSSDNASQETDVDASSDTAGEADPSLTFTEKPSATTQTPSVASSSSSGLTPIAAGNSTSAPTTSANNSKLCAKPRVVVTEVDVGAAVENNEDEAGLKVIAIAALPSGGSRIAFQSGDNVIVRELDANDKLVSSSPPVKVPLHDFGDIYADKNGFVIVGTRDAEGGGTLNCGNPSNMCGTAPSPAVPCYDMYMVRYDGTSEKWATKLTSSSASLPPYSTGKTGPDVYMIWWYAHHGRIAYDGTNWAAYFGAAISTSEGGCINIHQGDRMKVVSPSGTITDSKDSFDWGCSHSGYERIT